MNLRRQLNAVNQTKVDKEDFHLLLDAHLKMMAAAAQMQRRDAAAEAKAAAAAAAAKNGEKKATEGNRCNTLAAGQQL